MRGLYTPYFTRVSFVPPCSSIEHFWQPIDHDYPLYALTILHHNSLWNGSWIVINSSFQLLVIHDITCTHLNAFMQHIATLHLHLCNQSLTPFICIHSMHNNKIHKIFQCLSIYAILHWVRNTMHSTVPWPNRDYFI